jgi:hypothetical protein
MPLEDADEALMELIFLGLDHGVEAIQEISGPLVPFVLTEDKRGRVLRHFTGDELENALEQAYDFVRQGGSDFDRMVVVYDGYLTVEGHRTDAIYALGYVPGMSETFLFAQRYSAGAPGQIFSTLGNAAYLGQGNVDLT